MSSSSGTSSSGTSSSGPPPSYSGPPPTYDDKRYIPLKETGITGLPTSTVENIIATIGEDNVGKKVSSADLWDYRVAFQEEEQLHLSDQQVKEVVSAAKKVKPPTYNDS
jgi:hypothetical protein